MKLTKAQREVLKAIASREFVHFAAVHRKTDEVRMVYGNADHQFREKTVDEVQALGLIRYEYINTWLLTDAGRAALDDDPQR